MATTKIEWADAVWNPITGCTPISEGCDHCYARRMANRLKGRAGYTSDNPFGVTVHWDRIDEPMHWIKSRRVFVCSMGDIFHPDVSFNVINDVFDVMRQSGNLYGHTFMVLTKRPERMADFIGILQRNKGPDFRRWPLPFVWLGVTAENQQRADERIPVLMQIPAVKRFVSIEPCLSEIDLRVVPCRYCNHPEDVLQWPCPYCKGRRFECPDWVICGGETGPGARPLHPDWVRGLRDQCTVAGVPFFFKQWGEWGPYISTPDHFPIKYWDNGIVSLKVGKKASGRQLDGRDWSEFPKH